ncbi:MAG: GyrI-like domain-containing protein [Bdellovibrio sp.]
MEANITKTPEIVTRPKSYFIYLEKTGPFQVTAKAAWHEFWVKATNTVDEAQITSVLDMSKVDITKPNESGNIFRAGVTLKAMPSKIPDGLRMREVMAGKYAKFVLTGSYEQLPHAFPQIFIILAEAKIRVRDEYCVSVYVNSPEKTSEDKLLTEIFIPV